MKRSRIAVLGPNSLLPDPHQAPTDGPLAISIEISVERAIEAYRMGIFPWPSDFAEPISWWSPDPRCVLFLDDFHESRSLRKLHHQRKFSVTFDEAFDNVVFQCANRDGTWITPEIKDVFSRLHRIGMAHSVECWNGNRLVGGLYGMVTGRVFSGESMFSIESNTSKLALTALVGLLREKKFVLIDCQVASEHLLTLGSSLISRESYLRVIEANRNFPTDTSLWTDAPSS